MAVEFEPAAAPGDGGGGGDSGGSGRDALLAPNAPQSALLRGEPRAWDSFIAAHTPAVAAAIRAYFRGRANPGDPVAGELGDLVQEVFLRLVKDEYRLLRQFDPARASLKTYLALIARSVARESQRRQRITTTPLEGVPEAALHARDGAAGPGVAGTSAAGLEIEIPRDLVSPRQGMILTLLYEQDMDVAEVAAHLGVEAQTVRSQHHKALSRLRQFFGVGARPAVRPSDAKPEDSKPGGKEEA